MAAWKACRLLPGESAEARLALDGESSLGHHRHLVMIVGEDHEVPLGRILVTADAVSDRPDAPSIMPRRLDLGYFVAGVPIQRTVHFENPGETAVAYAVRFGETGVTPAEIVLAPHETRDVEVTFTPGVLLWGQRLEFTAGERTVSCEVLGVPTSAGRCPKPEVLFGDLGLSGLTELDDYWVADFGLSSLGTEREIAFEITNHGKETVALDRVILNGDDEFTTRIEHPRLEPGERGRVFLRFLGTRPPGSFRYFVHLLTDAVGAERVQLACAGVVASPDRLPPDSAVDRLELRVERTAACPSLVIRDTKGTSRFTVALPGPGGLDSGPPGAVCSNLLDPLPATLRAEAQATVGSGTLRVLSVWGDETLRPGEEAFLSAMDDPGGVVIDALHSDLDSDRPTFPGLDIAVFHDSLPVVREAARRTRIPAVFVALRGDAPVRVEQRRHVVIWNPSATTDRTTLVVYTRRGSILYHELTAPANATSPGATARATHIPLNADKN